MSNTAQAPIVSVCDVHRVWSVGGADFAALDGVSVEFARGALTAIVGASGSGKSTLLQLIAGIDRPSRGRVVVDGVDIAGFDEDALSGWRGAHVGVVFQSFQLLPTLTVAENVMLPMDFRGALSVAAQRERALLLLDQVGVRAQASKLPSALSGGQQQRVAIARALANDPALVVADEPTGNLDTASAGVVIDLLRGLTQRGTSVVMVTHERSLAARADAVVAIADGKIVHA